MMTGVSGPVRTLLLMAVGVVAVSLSGPLMALAMVPPLAIAFWRNAFATAALAPGALVRRREELRDLPGGGSAWCWSPAPCSRSTSPPG